MTIKSTAVIDTVKPYEGSYDDVVDQGQDEVNRGYMPPIKPLDVNLADYDVIPFMTNGGWPGHVIKDMEKACKGAKCVAPMEIQFDSTGGDHLETSEKEIRQWIKEVKNLRKGEDQNGIKRNIHIIKWCKNPNIRIRNMVYR